MELEVTGDRVEPAPYGARLVLKNSGRKIAYSRLLVVDATGRELPARMEVVSATPSLNPHPSTFNIFVNDTDAVYPIRIDPTFKQVLVALDCAGVGWRRFRPFKHSSNHAS